MVPSGEDQFHSLGHFLRPTGSRGSSSPPMMQRRAFKALIGRRVYEKPTWRPLESSHGEIDQLDFFELAYPFLMLAEHDTQQDVSVIRLFRLDNGDFRPCSQAIDRVRKQLRRERKSSVEAI